MHILCVKNWDVMLIDGVAYRYLNLLQVALLSLCTPNVY